MAKKRRLLRPYCVEFSSFQPQKYSRHAPLKFEPFQVQVQAGSVEEAKNIAACETLTRFISRIPKQVANICWSKDHNYPEAGYMSVQYPRGSKLSAPYHMTQRMKIEVTLGNIPVQLCFDFGDTD